MATLADPQQALSVEQLAARLARTLPAYARPAFLRIAHSLPSTGTHKVTKTSLKKEAFDIATVSDPIYVFDSKTGKYVRLTQDIMNEIDGGNVRL